MAVEPTNTADGFLGVAVGIKEVFFSFPGETNIQLEKVPPGKEKRKLQNLLHIV